MPGNVFRRSTAPPGARVVNNFPGRYPTEDWRAQYWDVTESGSLVRREVTVQLPLGFGRVSPPVTMGQPGCIYAVRRWGLACRTSLLEAIPFPSAAHLSLEATDEENRAKLLAELDGVGPEGRAARFRCAVAYVSPEGEEAVFSGTLEGSIAMEERGSGGFGYDPVFLVPEKGVTAAELAADEKNAISHRARALARFRLWLEEKEKAGGES